MVELEEVETHTSFSERLAAGSSLEVRTQGDGRFAGKNSAEAEAPVRAQSSAPSTKDDNKEVREVQEVPARVQVVQGTRAPEPQFHDAEDTSQGEDGAAQGTRGSRKEGENTGETEAEESFQDSMTEEELRKSAVRDAEALKVKGNLAYSERVYSEAMIHYASALEVCPELDETLDLRAACHGNRAACLLNVEEYTECIKACSSALELKPEYFKVLLRRAQAYESLDKLEEALADYDKVLSLDSQNKAALANAQRLRPIVEERREKLKEEMLGKLKDLGNSLLGHFGLSLDNFKAVKDPDTGSYSINFQS